MVIVKILLLFLILIPSVTCAGVIQEAFKRKDFKKVVRQYLTDPQQNLSKKELILISHSFRKLGRHRESIKLTMSLIRKFYPSEHKKIMTSVKKAESIDPDEFPKSLKIYYWNLFNSYAFIIKKYEDQSSGLIKDNKYFLAFSKVLSALEFREGKVDKTVDSIAAHIKQLEDKIYKFTASAFLQYVSWQQTAVLAGPGTSSDLVITNSGTCLGGDLGMENYLFHFYLDACFLYGSGAVDNGQTAPRYQQSNLPAYGLKSGPGASVIISSTGSRVGFKLPILYSVQELTVPKDNGYSIDEKANVYYMASLYSRWHFNSWFLESEFGKYIQKDEIYWGLGLGRRF